MAGRRTRSHRLTTSVLLAGLAACGRPAATMPDDGQWTMPGRDYSATRYSGLNEITAASHEQSVGIDQVNAALILIDANTQQNAALAEQAAAVAACMQQQSATLSDAVGVFRLVTEAPLPSRQAISAASALAATNTPHSHQISLA